MANGNGDALKRYLEQVRLIRGSHLATNERSYYPALDLLFNTVGEMLNPPVLAIHDVADAGAGHPDFTLQVKGAGDLRAVVEAKGSLANVDEIAQSEQVMRYLKQYGLCLVTNLYDFKLVRLNRANQPEEVMRQRIGQTEAHFWREPIETLLRDYGEEMGDFLTSVLLWKADVTRPKDLADALARYARAARREMERRADGGLQPLRKALAEALGLHFTDDQGEHFFRSSLVQTLFYGLFSAWVAWNRDHQGAPPEDFRWREAGDYLHLPVLRELFEHVAIPGQLESLHIRKPLEWAEATLQRTIYGNFASVFADGSAVNYFYEPFLEAYDPELREQLGVWYTPREIIQYQVARVDRLLREELRIADGLADDRVIVLDPATGTGGYLLEVLRVIDRTLRENGDDATRGMRLRKAATSRVFGFEILPAPFVVAHLQIATLLANLGGALGKHDRPGVYLTNALTGWTKQEYTQGTFEGWPALKREVETAADVKHEKKVLVVLGNPPYYGFAGVAEDEELELLAPYYVDLKERYGIQAQHLNDLYVRFLRLAERQIAETTGRGVVSFITNYTWLDGLSHAIMREHMVKAFDQIWIDSLNGDKFRTGKRTPWGTADQSIFSTDNDSRGIQVGTAITTMVRTAPHMSASVHWRQFWGKASEKRDALYQSLHAGATAVQYQLLQPDQTSRYILVPGGTEAAYLAWPQLDAVFFRGYSGVKTARDADLVSIDREPLAKRMRQYFDASLSDADLTDVTPVLVKDAQRFDSKATRMELLKSSRFRDDRIVPVAYRPFDDRWLYWEAATKLLDEKRTEFFEQVFPGNIYLAACMKGRRGGVNLPTITDKFSTYHLQDPYSIYFPLYVRHTGQARQRSLFAQPVEQQPQAPDAREPNFAPAILDRLMEATKATVEERSAIAEALFYHILAVSRAPLYESENAGYLMQDWPRIPLPATRELLEASAALGRRVGDLLRPDVAFTPSQEQRRLAVARRIDGGQFTDDDLRVTVRYNGIGRYEPGVTDGPTPRPSRLWWNDVAYWENVSPEVWAFTIGGYPVVKKWLDYRHIEKLKRPLRLDEVTYVSEMVRRIAALLALGPALDASYLAVKANTLALTSSAVPVPAGPFQTATDDEE